MTSVVLPPQRVHPRYLHIRADMGLVCIRILHMHLSAYCPQQSCGAHLKHICMLQMCCTLLGSMHYNRQLQAFLTSYQSAYTTAWWALQCFTYRAMCSVWRRQAPTRCSSSCTAARKPTRLPSSCKRRPCVTMTWPSLCPAPQLAEKFCRYCLLLLALWCCCLLLLPLSVAFAAFVVANAAFAVPAGVAAIGAANACCCCLCLLPFLAAVDLQFGVHANMHGAAAISFEPKMLGW